MKILQRFWDRMVSRMRDRVPQRMRPNSSLPTPYYLNPNVNGDFTAQMVYDAVALGEKNIVFNAETLNVYYAGSGSSYMFLENIKATEQAPITLDFSNVYIDCHIDPNNVTLKHEVFILESCENIILKFGTVEGDKFKRTFATQPEIAFEDSFLVRSGKGCKNITIDGGNVAGFMADAAYSIIYGSQHIDLDPDGSYYNLQGDGRYESGFYNVNPALYDGTFGLVGGLGFNRLLHYDMEDVTFKFFNSSNVQIAEITSAQYFITYSFPDVAGITKMKVNVNPMDGRIDSPTNFGHNLQYCPNSGTVVKNMTITDNHRGGISNIGANTLIDNCVFDNTSRYYTVPEFPDSTKYHINCEDAVSRNLIISNCTFSNKFHKLLLTHNISVDLINNTFSSDDFSIFIYDLIYGNATGNIFQGGKVSFGNGTNLSTVIVSNNTGSIDATLTNGAEWTNNSFTESGFSGKGKFNNNTITNSNYGGLEWNREIHSNIFIGNGGFNYNYQNSYNYNNTFQNHTFRFQHSGNPIYFNGLNLDNTINPSLVGFERTYGNNTIVSVNGNFRNLRITTDNTTGAMYFENCNFQDVSSYIIQMNASTDTPMQFYFKNCTFTGSGNFRNTGSTNTNYEITFDNCTIDSNIVMPPTFINGTVTTPALVEPRTQQIPVITRVGDRTEIYTEYHIMTLKIRNKTTSEIVLDKNVTSFYKHYNETPSNFEYSIDGGLYWDSL